MLSEMQFFGEGTPANFKKAVRWMTKAAEQGDASAQFRLATMHYISRGTDGSLLSLLWVWALDTIGATDYMHSSMYEDTLKWLHASAEQGHARAQFSLGNMYHEGEVAPQDYTEALKWYRLAAEQGYGQAQSALGSMYHEGKGVPQDNGKAHVWLNVGVFNGGPGEDLRDDIGKEMTIPQLKQAQELARECVRKEYRGC